MQILLNTSKMYINGVIYNLPSNRISTYNIYDLYFILQLSNMCMVIF